MLRLTSAFLLLVLPFTGCSRTHTRQLRFVSSPNAASNTIDITCQASTTGKCYFLFSGPTLHAEASVRVGASITVAQLDSGTQYCSGIHRLQPATCEKRPVEWRRVTVEKRSTTDAVSN